MKTLLLFALITTQVFAGTACNKACEQSFTTNFHQPSFQNPSKITHHSGEAYPETMANDPRKIRSITSPSWLEAVGSLTSTLRNGNTEQYTLSIVVDSPKKDGIIAITAGHCIAHWASSEGSNGFKVGYNEAIFTTNSGNSIKRTIAKVITAQMNPGDYAIVKLNEAISREVIKPLINSPIDYSDALDSDFFWEKVQALRYYCGSLG
ncbi:hypothetical protein [Amphritea japonica]|uniref:hypothetical protein n=1 Tax=Amphritea japonica TaxID=452627 RepID=UPI001916111C|nr:hypothetical protein [Amphritea japonica]